MGMIEKNDCIIVLSKSGESKEIIDLIPAIKAKKISLFSITENENSSIAKESKVHVKVKVSKEACPNDLAPTAMIMCPCEDGLSHNEAEEITKDWSTAGADVLFHAVVNTAEIID